MSLSLRLSLGLGAGGGASFVPPLKDALFHYDGKNIVHDGTNVSQITDLTANAAHLTASGSDMFTLDANLYPKKEYLDTQQMSRTLYTLNQNEYSVVLCLTVTGGSQQYQAFVMGGTFDTSLTGISNAANITCAMGADAMNRPDNQAMRGALLYNTTPTFITFPYKLIIMWSYSKANAGSRSMSVYIANSNGTIITSRAIAYSSDNIDTNILSLGRMHTTNASLFSFHHLSAYPRLLTASEQNKFTKYCIKRYF